MKKLIVLIALALFLSACSSVQEKDNNSQVDDNPRAHLQNKLDFDKDIMFVNINEVNDEALYERPTGGITSQDAYIKNGEMLYMFYDAKLPSEETNLIVMDEKYNSEYALDYELHQTNKDTLTIDSYNIENEYVNNDNRLLKDDVSIEVLKNDVVNVTIGDKSVKVNPNESDEISKSEEDVNSKMIIQNFGKINSIEDITYEELED